MLYGVLYIYVKIVVMFEPLLSFFRIYDIISYQYLRYQVPTEYTVPGY